MAVGAATLAGAWFLSPGSVPIYDGIDNPDEPYRFVQTAGPGREPTLGRVTVRASGGRTVGSGAATSAEIGPQVSWYVPALALAAPAGARTVTVTAAPLAPVAPLPRDGRIVTNVYRLTATADGGPVTVVAVSRSATPVLQMRAPSSRQPGPVFEHRVGDSWERVPTSRIGQDIYQALAPTLGDWALVQLRASESGTGVAVEAVLALVALLVLTVVVVVVRRRGHEG